MLVYLDTSAYAKKFVNEKGSDVLEDIVLNSDELAICVICIP